MLAREKDTAQLTGGIPQPSMNLIHRDGVQQSFQLFEFSRWNASNDLAMSRNFRQVQVRVAQVSPGLVVQYVWVNTRSTHD